MKKLISGLLLFCVLLGFRAVSAEVTCGTNVTHVIEGNTITFSADDPDADAVWDTDCGALFRTDPDVTAVVINGPIRVVNGQSLFSGFTYVQNMDLTGLDVSAVTDMR